MSSLTMRLTFANNVRVGTGSASGQLDEAIDHAALLSNGGIKGVLRDEARWLLPSSDSGDHPFVRAVFGDISGRGCPWNFDVQPVNEVSYSSRARLRLDEHGAVVKGALLVKEEASIAEALLEIVRRSPLSGLGLPEDLSTRAEECHLALLHLSARAAEKVGQSRSRGMGWVSFSTDRAVEPDLRLIWCIREGKSA